MEGDVVEADGNVPALSGDYYYMKALNYLAASADNSSDDGQCSCLHCPSPEDKYEDDHFLMGFRPGLTLDDHHGFSSSSGTDVASQCSSSPPTSSEHLRDRKNSRENVRLRCGRSDHGVKIRVKRRSSDGHVHWADEFRKDLTRCHPRKTYSRHPSHTVSQVKPILKLNPEDSTHN